MQRQQMTVAGAAEGKVCQLTAIWHFRCSQCDGQGGANRKRAAPPGKESVKSRATKGSGQSIKRKALKRKAAGENGGKDEMNGQKRAIVDEKKGEQRLGWRDGRATHWQGAAMSCHGICSRGGHTPTPGMQV